VVRELVLKHGARDTTQRGTALAELEAMVARPSQDAPGEEIPEAHWMYRLAKKYWFNDFGAYRGLEQDRREQGPGAQTPVAAEPLAVRN
jgi:hypothetical protein